MGLDGVELVMEVEESFGIQIKDEEAGNTQTVGQLYQLVCQKCQTQAQNSCPTRKAFCQLRKILLDLFKIDKDQIHPKTNIRDIANTIKSKHLWNCLKEKTNFRLPSLRLPRWLFYLLLLTGFLAGLLISYLIISFFSGSKVSGLDYVGFGIIIVPFSWIFLAIILSRLASPFATVIPNECQTVGNLSKQVVMLNAKHFGPLSKQEIWEILVKIISEQLGLKKEEIRPEHYFVKDYKMDS